MPAVQWTRSTTFTEPRKSPPASPSNIQTANNSNTLPSSWMLVDARSWKQRFEQCATVANTCFARLTFGRTTYAPCRVSAMRKPEPVLDAFKAYATRALRRAGLIGLKTRPWSRHGSTIYLWTEQNVAKAIEYVMLRQGDEFFRLDDE